jgi:hypothetical protein
MPPESLWPQIKQQHQRNTISSDFDRERERERERLKLTHKNISKCHATVMNVTCKQKEARQALYKWLWWVLSRRTGGVP